MIREGATLGAALLLGLVGSVHCLGMCGGIAGALGQSLPPGTPLASTLRASLYSLGRITSYALAGALVGAAGQAFAAASGLGLSLRIVAGLLIIGIGLHIGGWWNGLALLERAGLGLWRKIMPLAQKLGRPDRAWKVFAIGLLWGWLPCGLVYSSLAVASTTGSAHFGALFMFCFGLGTLPALLAAASLAATLRQVMQRRSTRHGAAILLVIFGVWTLYGVTGPLLRGSAMHHGSAGHAGSSHEQADTEPASKPHGDEQRPPAPHH